MTLRLARLVSLSIAFAIVLVTPVWIALPTPVAASTASSMSSTILTQLNHDRASLGLDPLRVDSRLAGLATNRAQWMSSTNEMSHNSYGGSVFSAVAMVGVDAYSSGEAVGATTAPFGVEAGRYLYGLWRGSPEHWSLMTSGTFNYIGVGTAYNGSTGQSFASLVFAEAPDVTPPIAQMVGSGLSGRTVFFIWTGHDVQLQSHTAGLRTYDVEYRVDTGTWRMIRSATTTTQMTITNRPAGHTYSVRIRDRDRRNNLSGWSSVKTVRVR